MCILLPYKSPLLSTPPSINMPPVSDISRIGNRWEGTSGSEKVYLTELKVSGQRRQWHPTPVLLPGKSRGWRSLVGCSPWGTKSWIRLSDFTLTFHFHALEKEMATHSSVLAWRIPGTGEPGGLLSMGSHRVYTTEAT